MKKKNICKKKIKVTSLIKENRLLKNKIGRMFLDFLKVNRKRKSKARLIKCIKMTLILKIQFKLISRGSK